MIIRSFEIDLCNIETGQITTITFESDLVYIDAWREATNFAFSELMKRDKTWYIKGIRHIL